MSRHVTSCHTFFAFLSVFHKFFVNISAILRAVEVILSAIKSGSLDGQLGIKIILPPNFSAPTFLPLRFFTFFQRILEAHM